MKRATSVYMIMLIAFGMGLWGIITTGTMLLRAPHDLSGRWELRERQASPEDDPIHVLTIDQSGRFFRIGIDGRGHSLTLGSERRQDDPPRVRMELGNGGLSLVFESIAGSDAYLVQAGGALQGQWLAVRVVPGASRPAAASSTAASPSIASPSTQHARS